MGNQICEQPEYVTLFLRIDALIKKVHQFQQNDFQEQLHSRETTRPNFDMGNDEFLKIIARLIAFSQQAQAKNVRKLIDSGLWDEIFCGFKVRDVSRLNSKDILAKYWIRKSERPETQKTITAIRYPHKVEAIINCAKVLQEIEAQTGLAFSKYVQNQNLPLHITSENELNLFWERFSALRKNLGSLGMPFLNRFTTLCHLLKDLGYDCAKPDSAVMNAAVKLGIIKEKNSWTDDDRAEVVRIMQIYGFCRGVKPPVLDLYFLIHGKQTEAVHLIEPGYFLAKKQPNPRSI